MSMISDEKIPKIKEIYKRYNEEIDQISKKIFEELKGCCETYADLHENLGLFRREVMWLVYDRREVDAAFIAYIEKLVNKEANDLPIANRSKK